MNVYTGKAHLCYLTQSWGLFFFKFNLVLEALAEFICVAVIIVQLQLLTCTGAAQSALSSFV